jgi:GNAT superfamily N-acetyltransferase
MKVTPSKIAAVDARRMALVMREIGGGGEPINSGWMVYDGPGSWASYAAGLGLSGPVTSAEIRRLVDFYDAHGMDAQVQTTPYQDPSLFSALAEHHFVTDDFTIMFVHDLKDLSTTQRPGLEFIEINPGNDEDIQAFVDAQMIGFYAPKAAPEGITAITGRVGRHPRCRIWLLKLDGKIVGSGGLEVFENSAVLIAGAIFPEARRKGIQSAFVNYRLRVARDLGLDYALVGSVPNGGTERNALRQGFVPIMTQIFLRRRFGGTPQ